MPPKPKPAPAIPKESYIFEFIVNKLLVDPQAADYNKIMISIKIGELVSFDLAAERIDCLYKKTKISHEINVTHEQLINIVKLPLRVHFNELTPEMEKELSEKANNENPSSSQPPPTDNKRKTKISTEQQNDQEEEKVVDNHFGEFKIKWLPVVLQRVTKEKFSIQTQFEERDIYKPIIKEEESEPEPEVKKVPIPIPPKKLPPGAAPPEPESDDEDIPREIIGFISCVIRFQVKPKTDRATLSDTDGILNVVDEIDSEIDSNDTIFVIGRDEAAKYEKFLTHCNDMHCQVRIDISKFRSLHGRLVHSPLIISPCGNLECCDECSDEDDCFCNKVVAELEETRKKNYCYRKRRGV